ncbi:MAG: DNA repair protein RecN [Succinatimonas sp.]|nr:DNA repair protein RecN [Succinatimonas sp.]
MLLSLSVRDFALSEKNTLDFDKGMSCITGETGAGKSLTVDALALICGQRAESSMVKKGASKAILEAVFSKIDESIVKILAISGIDCEDDNLIISRQIFVDGKSKAYINSHAVNLSLLKQITSSLVAVHGQHASISLLDADNQLRLVDEVGKLGSLREKLNEAFSRYNQERAYLSELSQQQKDGALQYKNWRHDLELLRNLNLSQVSYETVSERYDELQRLLKSSDAVALALASLDNDEHNIIDIVAHRLDDLKALGSREGNLGLVIDNFTEALKSLDAARIALMGVNTEVSPELLSKSEQELSLYHELARKFSVPPERLYTVEESLSENIEQFLALKDLIAAKTIEVKALRDEYEKLSLELSEKRQLASVKMSEAITLKIRKLSMPEGQFEVQIVRNETIRPRKNGRDEVSFLFTANRGQALQNLGMVASGGELSRLALALEELTASENSIPTLIFDEVDTGISGRTASAVGSLLKELSKQVQVIVITHLPQVAACADSHFLVVKENTQDSTYSEVRLLNRQERIYELGRMMGGNVVTEATLAGALALLDQKS